jgi:glycosyltransferase involved in cell wall biosynthesis
VPDVVASVVITCRNYAAFVGAAIDSALAQSHPRTEVVVVDDGSTDGSPAVISSYGSAIRAVFREHGGQGAAMNAGFAASRGDVVVFLDADDMLEPGVLAAAAARFRQGIVKVHWPLRTADERGRVGGVHPIEPLAEGSVLEAVVAYGPEGYIWPVTSGNAWSRAFLERVLPMPEAEFRGAAESYLAALAPAFGDIARIAEPMGIYRMHPGSASHRRLVGDLMLAVEGQYGVLERALRRVGVTVDSATWSPTADFRRQVRQTVEELQHVMPAHAVFGFVEWQQWGPGEIVAGARSVPFPGRHGFYSGRPATDASAVAELERARADGMTHLVVAWPALWWLEHYAGLRAYVQARFRRLAASERVVVFDLAPRP